MQKSEKDCKGCSLFRKRVLGLEKGSRMIPRRHYIRRLTQMQANVIKSGYTFFIVSCKSNFTEHKTNREINLTQNN